MPSYSDWLKIFGPPWLQDDGAKAMLGAMGGLLDRGVDQVRQSVLARFPTRAPSDALVRIGDERQLPRAPWETEADWAVYLRSAWAAWGGDPLLGGGAGTPLGLLTAVSRSGVPFRYATDLAGSPDATTYVQWNGRWAQLYADTRTPVLGFLDGCLTHAPPSFLPTNLGSTLRLWLRADLGVVKAGSGFVTSVADQSGNGLNVAYTGNPPLAVPAAISGRPGLDFNGSGGPGYLYNVTSNLFAAGSPRTIFVVSQATSEVGGPLLESRFTPGVRAAYLQAGSGFASLPNGVYADTIDASRNATVPPRTITGVPTISEFKCAAAPAPLAVRINGVLQTVTQTNPCDAETGSTGFSIGRWGGAGQYFIGTIAEVIVCDSVLSDADAARVRAYLSVRYQIAQVVPPPPQPGWYDDGTLVSKSYLLFPTPGGVVDGLSNTQGNALKQVLNATVRLWKRASEVYGGAYVFNSQGPDYIEAPEGTDEWFLNQDLGGAGALGWPPVSMDPNRVLGDTYVLPADTSTFIDTGF